MNQKILYKEFIEDFNPGSMGICKHSEFIYSGTLISWGLETSISGNSVTCAIIKKDNWEIITLPPYMIKFVE